MESVCTAVPLKPGMWETIRQYRDELVSALDHANVAYAREHRGFRVVKIFHQTTPIEALVLYFEADNLKDAFDPRHQDNKTQREVDSVLEQGQGFERQAAQRVPAAPHRLAS